MVRTTIAICCDKCGKILGGDDMVDTKKCYGRYIDDKGGVEVYLCEECMQKIVKNKLTPIEDRFDMFRNRLDSDTKVSISIELCSTTIGSISTTSTTVLTVDIGFIGRSLTDDEDVVIMATNGKFFRRDQAEELIYNIFDYDYINSLRHKYKLKNASERACSSSSTIVSSEDPFGTITLC